MEQINLNNFLEVNPKEVHDKVIRITKSGIYFPISICSKKRVKILINEDIILFNFSDDEGYSVGQNGLSNNSKRINMGQMARLRRIFARE